MVLQRINADTIGLKMGQVSVQLKTDGQIRVGDKTIEGPGEYDIAGVGLHVFPAWAVVFAEGVRIAAVWPGGESLTSDDESSEFDVFILFLPEAKQATTIVKEHDPRLVVIHDETLADALAAQDGVTVARESAFKLTAATLPMGDRSYIVLT